ncbi:MAG TPA: hypothetical protein VFB58_00495, partial [Chloroflexota bacterium]|nr:hypothetical protein [Chloroflexota bacterium]
MLRVSLTLALVAGFVASAAPTVQAAGAPSWHVSRLLPLTAAPHRGVTPYRLLPALRPQASPRQTSQQLEIPPSAFSPAQVDTNPQVTGYGVTAQAADSYWFYVSTSIGNHSKPYDSFGYEDGTVITAIDNNPNPPGLVHYLAAIYNSTANASALFNDGVTTTQYNYNTSSSSCAPAGAQFQCRAMVYQENLDTGNNVSVLYDESYNVLQVNQCVTETAVSVPDTEVNGFSGEMDTIQTNVDNAALEAMSKACGSGTGNPGPNPTPQPPPGPQPKPTPSPTPQPTPIHFHVVVKWDKAGSHPSPGHGISKATAGKAVQGEV